MELERIQADLAPAGAAAVDDRTRQVLDYVGDRVADRVHAKSIAGVQLTDDQVRELLDAWLDRTADGSKTYGDRLKGFVKFLGVESTEAAVQHFFSLTQGEMNACADRYKREILKTCAAATARLAMSALRSLAKKARLLGFASAVPEYDPVPKDPPRRVEAPSRERIYAVLGELGHLDTPKAIRDRAMIGLCYITGLRVGEVCAPRFPEDLDLERQRIRIRGKKRTDKEWIGLRKLVARYLADWIAERGEKPGALFPRPNRNADLRIPFLRRSFYRIVRFEYNLSHPHALRHAAAIQGLEATGDVHKVQQFLRHSDVSTTGIYLRGRKDYAGEISGILAGEPATQAQAPVPPVQAAAAPAPALAGNKWAARDAAIVALRKAGKTVPALAAMQYPADVAGVAWPAPALEALNDWLAVRGDWPGSLFVHVSNGYRFTARDPITPKTIEYVLYRKMPLVGSAAPLPQAPATPAAVQAPAMIPPPQPIAPATAPESEAPARPAAPALAFTPPAAPPAVGIRDARDAAIRLLLASGMSPARLAAMQYPADVDGRTWPGPLEEYLRAWLADRGRWAGPLFTGTTNGQGHALTRRAIYDAAAGGRNGRQERLPAHGRYRRHVTRRRQGTPIVCPRCGNDAFVNTTRRKGPREVVRYYKCPTCLFSFRKRQTTVDGIVCEAEALDTTAPAGRAWDLARLYEHQAAAVSWIWPGYLARGALTLLAGEPKAGKSTLTFSALGALLRGGAFLGSAVEPLPVLYFTEEPAAAVREKCEAFGLTKGLPLSIVFRSEVKGTWTRALAVAHAHLKERPALLVLDTLAAWGVPETNVRAIEEVGNVIKNLAAQHQVPVLALHHTRKTGGTGLARIRGHSALAGAVDVALLLEQCAHGIRRLDGQGRFRETPARLHYAMEGAQLVLAEDPDAQHCAPDLAAAGG